jgi:hypothetical protein
VTLTVIGAGLGRTGTNSLRLALDELGLGPCHHMYEVHRNQDRQVPLWRQAALGHPDWTATFRDYRSACDWPCASFYAELADAFPKARFVLSTRSTESWVRSFTETIAVSIRFFDGMPPARRSYVEMVTQVLAKVGVNPSMRAEELAAAYEAHNRRVRATIPAGRLLVFEVTEGWAPLCDFLGVPAPDTPFPRSNDRADFHARDRTGQQ